MTRLEYLALIFRENHILTTKVMVRLFTIPLPIEGDIHPEKYTPYAIYNIDNVRMFRNGETDELIELTDGPKITEPLFVPKEEIVIDGLEPDVKPKTKTTPGRLLKYYVISKQALNGKIPFDPDKDMLINDYENRIAHDLEVEDKNDTTITVAEFKQYHRAIIYLETLSTVVTKSATHKSITAPPGIAAKVKELKKKYDLTDQSQQVKFEAELDKFDRDYLKDDETLGKTLTGKMMGRRKKMYLVYGSEDALTGPSDYIATSLSDGLPTDGSGVATTLNVSRAGSINRGSNTQIGGVIFKNLTQAIAGITAVKGDCGSKRTRPVHIVTEADVKKYAQRYKMVGGKAVLLGEVKPGKYHIRTPIYCNEKTNYCSTCVGDNSAVTPDSIIKGVNTVSKVIISFFMKAMHGRDTANYTVKDINLEVSKQ